MQARLLQSLCDYSPCHYSDYIHATSHCHSRSRRTHGTTAGRPGRGRSRTCRSSRRSMSPDIRGWAKTPGVVAGVKALGVPISASLDVAADVVIDFSVPAAAEKIIEVCRQKKIPLVVATTGFDEAANGQTARRRARNPAALVAQHEPGGQSDDEAGRDGGRGAEGPRRRRGNPRTASPLQGRRPQRHGLEVRPDHRRGDGPDRTSVTAAKAGPASARTAKSATTPSASATIPASTPSSSACWARRSSLRVRATNRDCYAAGALAAAKFLAGKKPGLYGMNDVLGL